MIVNTYIRIIYFSDPNYEQIINFAVHFCCMICDFWSNIFTYNMTIDNVPESQDVPVTSTRVNGSRRNSM